MFAITLNPGFVCILAALIALATPRAFRPLLMGASAVLAMWLMLDRDFGAATAAAQMGLPVVLLDLDALNRIFGIAMLIALVILAIASGARRSRSEDAAILLMAGGAVSALFVGDLVSFVASAALAGLATAWLVFSSPLPDSARTGGRLLIWQGLEGLLFLVGVAFQLSAGAASSIFAQLDVTSIGGASIFAALMIRVGAPMAHVWLKDAAEHASPIGAAALSAFTTMLGVYALARFFPSEPILIWIGVAMVAVGAAYAMAEDDFRRAAASGLTAQTGICVTLIGLGSPLALAAAEGHAFTTVFAFVALQLLLGGIVGRTGSARASDIGGVARRMPISAVLLLFAGLAAAATPGLAAYATTAIALEAAAQWQFEWVWIAIAATPGALLLALALRPSLVAFFATPEPQRRTEAPFPILLGASLAVFFCVSVGMAPAWLYGLLPTALAFEPYALDRIAPQLELMGAAGLGYILMRGVRLVPAERPLRLLDVDAIYSGPAAGAGRWIGVVLLRLYGAWQGVVAHAASTTSHALNRWVLGFDRPYRMRFGPFAQILTIIVALSVAVVWRRFEH